MVTSNSYFYLGVCGLIKDLSGGEASRLSLDSLFNQRNRNQSCLFIVYFDDMISNLKALLFFENMNSNVVFISKNENISKLCSIFGFNSIKVEMIMGVNAMFRKRSEYDIKRTVLSNMERKVITRLLDGDSAMKLARKEKLSDKTISHHKRSALVKVGVGNINLLFDSINKDIFSLL
ncbi:MULTISPECIES: LuxR C-terminal-related transcriptional regulator [unclassified Serratia (in: enterobacteria)]|uniref:LuxR C-terminal-related transcriptional regulator n=1 Tax=unclassified Serratia (in: enterobacteria) TaxID=2647522 RepID=UPI0013773AF2|nr:MULTISPECIES: LuxR C-terminal-related transcriptional regulator [unclassified Serratia (in: enterobacteria)]